MFMKLGKLSQEERVLKGRIWTSFKVQLAGSNKIEAKRIHLTLVT